MVNITKKNKIQLILFVGIYFIGLFLLGCENHSSQKYSCAYESQKRLRMLGPCNFTEEELISICGSPNMVMNANDLFVYLNKMADNGDTVNQIIMNSYIGCKWYLLNYEPEYDTWRKSDLFNQFDFYLYDEEIQFITCAHMGRKKSGFHSVYFILNDSKVMYTGVIPKVETVTTR